LEGEFPTKVAEEVARYSLEKFDESPRQFEEELPGFALSLCESDEFSSSFRSDFAALLVSSLSLDSLVRCARSYNRRSRLVTKQGRGSGL
jgi:hypothetical protein